MSKEKLSQEENEKHKLKVKTKQNKMGKENF